MCDRTDVLSPLLDTPLAPLAPAAVVRSRGVQRRRRTRAAVAGGAVGVLLLGAGVTSLAVGRDAQQTLQPAGPTTAAPVPTGAAPTSSLAPTARGEIAESALLAAGDLGPGWERPQISRSEDSHTSLDPCAPGLPDHATTVTHSLGGAYQLRNGPRPSSSLFTQAVYRYPTPAAAAADAAQLRAVFSRCPASSPNGDDVVTMTVVQTAPFLVVVTSTRAGAALPSGSYGGIAVHGDLLERWTLSGPLPAEATALAVADRVEAALVTAAG